MTLGFGLSKWKDEIAIVNYRLALTKSSPNDWTTRHLPSTFTEIEHHAAIAGDLQQPPWKFRVEWGTLCSRESGGQVFR